MTWKQVKERYKIDEIAGAGPEVLNDLLKTSYIQRSNVPT